MDRRAFLAAALATAAGCSDTTGRAPASGSPSEPTPAGTGTQTPVATTPTGTTPQETRTPTDRADADTATATPGAPRVTNAQPQTAVLHLTQPDALGVIAPDRAQFLLLEVVAGDRVGGHRLRVRTGEASFSRSTELLQRQWLVDGDAAERYGADHFGWVAFDLPATGGADISLAVEGTDASTPLADAVGRQLADPPEFTVESVIREGTAVRVRVRNDGGDGVFRGALNLSGTVYGAQPVSFRVGGDTTHERTVDVGYGEDAEYTFLWPGGERTL